MVIDAFLFHNEFDLLDLRLNILDPYVDKFVLVEATETFSGLPKPLYYEENKERFKQWEHKIVHHVVEGATMEEWNEAARSPNTGGLGHWCREYVQRENIKKGLIKAGATDEDIVFFGDVDEIWDPQHLHFFGHMGNSHKIRLRVYSYWLNNLSSEEFWGPIRTTWGYAKDKSLNWIKNNPSWTYTEPQGWHFTSMGGVEALKKKIESYGHQELNTEEIKAGLEHRLSTGQDFIGRPFTYSISESDWPGFLKKPENRDRYKHLIKQNA